MKIVLEEYLQCIDAAAERIERLEQHMKALLEEWHLAPVVKALMGFRGYQTVAAMITVSELGDIHRFAHPRQLMAYRRVGRPGVELPHAMAVKNPSAALSWPWFWFFPSKSQSEDPRSRGWCGGITYMRSASRASWHGRRRAV